MTSRAPTASGAGFGRVKIAPSLLTADFGHLADEVQRAEQGGADWIHVDVMDGAFAPNLSVGPMVLAAIRRATRLPLDVHMMVAEPARFVAAFRDAGADLVTIHVEADVHPQRTLAEIRRLGALAGVAVNPGTSLAAVEELLRDIDLLLVMSVNPGFGGQAFLPTSVSKIARARQMLAEANPSCELEVDGGVNLSNAAEVARAGATVVVSGSAVYDGKTVEANVQALRAQLDSLRTI